MVRRIFFAMLLPTILMNLTTALASFADTVIIGHFLGEMSLSVVTYATPVYMVINTFAALFAVGGSITMGIAAGRGDRKEAGEDYSMAVEFLLAFGLVLLAAGAFFSRAVTSALGAEPEVFSQVQSYTRIVLIGAPVFTLNIGFAFFVRNDGQPTLSMAGMFLSIVGNIVMDILFIGVMGMGVEGAALATVLGQLASLLVIGSHLFSGKNTLKFSFCMNREAFRILESGASTALHFLYQFLTVLILNHLVSRMGGTQGVVVLTVVFNLYTVSLALFEGLSQTVQPMFSVFYGERTYRKILETLRLVLLTALFLCGSITVFLELFPQVVPTVFGIADAGLMERSQEAVRIYALSMVPMTTNVILGYYLQSTEHSTLSSVFVSLRSFALFLPCVLLLGKPFGMNGVWSAYLAAEFSSCAILLLLLSHTRNRMRGKGTSVNLLLLDEKEIQGSVCLTLVPEDGRKAAKGDQAAFEAFSRETENAAAAMTESGRALAAGYLKKVEEELFQEEGCRHKGRLAVQADLSSGGGQLILRDCLKAEKREVSCLQGEGSEYGLVLGWNRLLIKR